MRLAVGRGVFRPRMFSGGGAGLAFLFATVLGVVLAFGGSSAAAQKPSGHSVYEAGHKPVLSYILSQPENAKDFQEEFSLSDGEMDEVHAALRKENEKLATVYAASEQIVESNKDLSKERIADKISASSYDERVDKAVAHTKDRVEKILPAGHKQELESWVDAAWQQEQQQATTSPTSDIQFSSVGVTYRVYATQYDGYSRYEVALPHKKIKFAGGHKVRLSRRGHRAWAPVKDTGPWNTRDDYWRPSRLRDMWSSLPRGVSEARAAYYRNFHNGRDQFGRRVLNPASIDLTPAVGRKVGLRHYASGKVYVYFPWTKR